MKAETLARIYESRPAATITTDDAESMLSFLLWECPDVVIVHVDGQPYQTSKELAADIETNGRLKVSRDNNTPCPQLLSKSGNLLFRAVHDWHHYVTKGGFNLKGEFKAYKYAVRNMQNRRLRKILFSEIVLQAAYAIARKEFAPQKVVL